MKPFSILALASALAFIGCGSPEPVEDGAAEQSAPSLENISVRKQFLCLPHNAAFIAAHRGVSKRAGLAENSKGALQELINRGIMFAELDIAGLKDGTHILFHDGVWDEKTVGEGAVAASNWSDVSQFLLRDTEGELTSETPFRLEDALQFAKGKIYLEIDFKSSAKYEHVIGAIRDMDMMDDVILIAYNERQAARMASLAPEAMISVTVQNVRDVTTYTSKGIKLENIAAWMGRSQYPEDLARDLAIKRIPILAWPPRSKFDETTEVAKLIVSDYAFNYDPIVGLTPASRAEYEKCITSDDPVFPDVPKAKPKDGEEELEDLPEEALPQE